MSWRAFTTEFKAEAVRLVRESGKSVLTVARELDLTETALRRWGRQAEVPTRAGELTSEERDGNGRHVRLTGLDAPIGGPRPIREFACVTDQAPHRVSSIEKSGHQASTNVAGRSDHEDWTRLIRSAIWRPHRKLV